MIDSTPQTVRNCFEDQIRRLYAEDRMGVVRRYYDLMSEECRTRPITNLMYSNIDDRLSTSRYFYFPTETSAGDMNCFERAASVYFMIREVYPESDPALIFLRENDNLHASTIFTHDGELWGADPSYWYLDRILLEDKRILVLSDEREFGFDNISVADNRFLDQMVKKLRCESGIVDFIYGSGQRASYSANGGVDQSLFLKISEGNDIVSEIRVFCEASDDDHACIRFVTNPVSGTASMNFLRYADESWGVLTGVYGEKISPDPLFNMGSRSSVSHAKSLQDVAHYMTHDYVFPDDEIERFSRNSMLISYFGRHIDIARIIGDTNYWDFIRYLRYRLGPEDNLRIPEQDNDPDMFQALKNIEDHISLSCSVQLVPPLLKFIRDQKRYVQEIVKQMGYNMG